MTAIMDLPRFVFIIDTNDYAGNFARQMTAYLTGEIGECEVGDGMAKLFEEEVGKGEYGFYESVTQQPDEHGCFRPTSPMMTPGTDEHNSVGIFFNEKPSGEAIELMIKRAKKFARKRPDSMEGLFDDKPFKIRSFRLVRYRIVEDKLDSWRP